MPIDHAVATELSTELIHMVKRVESLRAHAPRLHPGLEPSAYPLLFVLTTGPMRISVLAENIHSDVSTVSRQVTHLVQHNLVAKVSDPDDGRAQRVALTEDGQSFVTRLQDGRGSWFQHLLHDWNDIEVRQFSGYLRRFIDDLSVEIERLRLDGPLTEFPPNPDTRKDAS